MRGRRLRRIALALTGAALCTLGAVWLLRASPEAHAAQRAAQRGRSVQSDVFSPSWVIARERLPALPKTFVDTEVDGGFDVAKDGHLIATERALQLFQYFFSATGLESEQVIVSRIVHEIRARLSQPARDEALALLRDFLAYRQGGRELADELEDSTAEERVEALYALRRESFGEHAAQGLFERDERIRAVHMERARIVADPDLDPFERAEALRAAEAELPAGLREQRAASTLATRLNDEVARLRAEGASDDDVFAVRRAELGEAGAERLAVVDREERDFASGLARLEALATGPTEPSAGELEAFIAANFVARDRMRARALLAAGFPKR